MVLAYPRFSLAAALAVSTSGAAIAQVTLPSVKDNTLYEDPAGALSNGAGTGFFVGRVGPMGTFEIRRGLVAFDPASAIPPGSTITKATLRLYMTKTVVPAKNVGIHRVLADWGEGTSSSEGTGAPATPGDATWLHRFYNTSLWATSGGDFTPSASATQLVDGIGFYEWSSDALVADVQAWLDTPTANFGWIVVGDETTPLTAKRFASREWLFPSEQPALIVEFQPAECQADCDADEILSIDDFICFQTLFALGDPAADCDADQVLSIDDFICFQTLFALGC